ncbi:MAG: YitT family protein, partial [Trichococcus flocculiformis]
MTKHLKNMLLVIVAVIITAIGASFTVKANVGVGAYEALNMSINQLSGIKIGTLAIILNITCVGIQWLLMKKDFSLRQLFQIPVTLILGQVMNLMLYTVFSGLTIDQYWVKIAMVILGGIIAAIGVGSMMALNYISMPLEGACMAFSNRFGFNFGKVRQIVDVLLIAAALLIAFSTDTAIT